MIVTLDTVTTAVKSVEGLTHTIAFTPDASANLIVVGVSSVFKTVAPTTCTWNGLSMSSQGAITSPGGKSKVELFSLYNPGGGTHNIVVTGVDVFVGVTSIYSFIGANRNPIRNIKTQTGTTGQNPNLSLLSSAQDFTVELFTEDSGLAALLTLAGNLTARGSSLLVTANCLGFAGGASVAGVGAISATWDASSSWGHLGVSIRGIELVKTKLNSPSVSDHDKYQWILGRRP